MLSGNAEKDKERAQRHHDQLVIGINAAKNDLREKKKERGAVADANRKAGCATLPAMHSASLLHLLINCCPDTKQG